MVIAIPLLFAILGLVLYVIGSAKWSEVGRILLFCGLLVTLLAWSGRPLHIG